jgi:hypothetical protein
MFNACAIAASSADNGFCSALAPNVMERVFSFIFRYRGGCLSIATPNPTSSFRAELLVAIWTNPPGTVGDCGVASTPACTRTFPWCQCERIDGFQCFHLDVLQRVCSLVQRRTMVSSEFLDPCCIPAERIGFWQGMYVRPHLHGSSPETVLNSGKVGLHLCYTGHDCEECSYNRLRSYPLDAVDRPHGLVLARVHPDIGRVVHGRRHRRCK